MSRIFEALQKSEAKRASGAFVSSPLAEEILDTAEQETMALAPRQGGFISLPLSIPYGSHLVAITQKESLGGGKIPLPGRETPPAAAGTEYQENFDWKYAAGGRQEHCVSANLAATLARRQQQRVLLIEGDLRRPVLAQRLGHIGLDGLAEWLIEGQSPLPNIYQLEDAGFCLIPAGSPPENPLELMQPDRLQGLLSRLSLLFDWIIIDAPPLLPLADATVWSKLSDGVLLVVREGKSEKKYLQRGLSAVESQEPNRCRDQ